MLRCRLPSLLIAAMLAALSPLAAAQDAAGPKTVQAKLDTSRGDAMIADYFRRETKKLSDACLTSETLDEWSYLTRMRNRLQWPEGQLMIGCRPNRAINSIQLRRRRYVLQPNVAAQRLRWVTDDKNG
jgi:hypothetical protein